MKRSLVYVIVVLLTLSLVIIDNYIGKDLKNIMPLDDTYRSIEPVEIVGEKEITAVGTITLKNEQNTDKKQSYNYLIKINTLAGAYRYTYQGKEDYVVFTANGEATLQLNSNEELTIFDVPVDLEFTIIQETTNPKFIVKANTIETNTYQGKTAESNTVVFNNSTKKGNNNKSSSEEPKEPTKKEEKKKESKKKDIPNTGEKEIKAIAILVLAIIMLIAIKKFKVKRFD